MGRRAAPESDDEDELFEKYKPLPRLLYLSIGPLVSQIVLTAFGLLDCIWATHGVDGTRSLAVLGAIFIVEFISIAMSEYFMTGFAARAAFCFGQRRFGCASQMFVDFLRMCFAAGGLTVALVLPLTKPMITYFGGEADFAKDCFGYMLVQALCSCLKYAYMLICGAAECEGAQGRFTFLQLLALGVDQACNALFILVLGMDIRAIPLSRACGEGLAAVIGFVWLVRRPDHVRVEWGMFVTRFSRDTWIAVKSGFAAFTTVLCENLPSILIQKFITAASAKIGPDAYEAVLAAWNIAGKCWNLVSGICIAVNLGLLPAAAYAYAARRFKEVVWLHVHGLWMTTLVSSLIAGAIIVFPRTIARLWGSEEMYLDWNDKITPPMFYGCAALGLLYITSTLLQAVQRPVAATVLETVTQLLLLPAVAVALYLTDDKGVPHPERVMYAYPINDALSFGIDTAVLIYVGVHLWRRAKTEGEKVEYVSVASMQEERVARSAPGVRTPAFYADGDLADAQEVIGSALDTTPLVGGAVAVEVR